MENKKARNPVYRERVEALGEALAALLEQYPDPNRPHAAEIVRSYAGIWAPGAMQAVAKAQGTIPEGLVDATITLFMGTLPEEVNDEPNARR